MCTNCHRMLLPDKLPAGHSANIVLQLIGQVRFTLHWNTLDFETDLSIFLNKFACIYRHIHDFTDLPPALIAALHVFWLQLIVLKLQSNSQSAAGSLWKRDETAGNTQSDLLKAEVPPHPCAHTRATLNLQVQEHCGGRRLGWKGL